MFLNTFPLATGQVQDTRHARQVYVGGLPHTANEQSVATFFSKVMAAIGGNSAGPGDAVVNVCINHEKKFAFVEMRSMEEASNVLALDGIIFEGAPVKVSRPGDYNPSLAATLGPSQSNPKLNVAAVGLTPGSAGGLDSPADHIFVGGLPYDFTEAQLRMLLGTFGPLRCLDLIKGRETGKSKGYALCLYQDLSVTDVACAALNGIKLGDMTLTVRRANQGANQPKPDHESVLLHAKQQIALQGAPVKVSRPGDYNPSLAATLGPSQPNSRLNMAAVGLTPGSAGGLEGPADHIFVGGFPYYCTEAEIRKLLESFGPLRCLDLIKDRETGKSKGYALCVYQDLSVTDTVCAALNGIKMGDTTLTVRRENQNANQPNSEEESILLQNALQLMLQPGSVPTKVLCLSQVVTADQLKDDEEYYEDILEDMRQVGKFGTLVNVVIPQPNPNGKASPGVGKVFLEYADVYGAMEARSWLDGRKFGGNQVVAVFYPENKFTQGDYEG